MTGSLFSILWLILIASSLLSPLLDKRRTESARVKLLNTLSRKRGSRVISMIHRMEAFSFLGIPISRHIDIEDLERFMLDKVGLWVNQGYSFGSGGDGFIRMNIGCPRSILEKALTRLHSAVDNL
jgi:aspartate/methionine/tyrosine aminotransferase